MDPSGMVHALEIIHSRLNTGGILVDIHPTVDPPAINLYLDRDRFHLGYLQESDDFIEYSQADQAISQAVQRGLFRIERQSEFIFNVQAAIIDELKDFLTQNWTDAILPEGLDQRYQEALDQHNRPESQKTQGIVISEHIRIARLLKT